MLPNGEALARKFFPGTGRSYDRVVAWTTLGLDARWKRKLLSLLPDDTRNILELASGTGILTRMLLRRFPSARILGVDLTPDYQSIARARFADRPGQVEFRLGDATTVPVADRGPFDAVVSCYVPKYVNADTLVAHLTPTVRSGGIAALHDFSRPHHGMPHAVWRAWFAVLHRVAPRLHPEWSATFDASLADLIERSRWVILLQRAFVQHGWVDVREHRLSFRSATIVSARRP